MSQSVNEHGALDRGEYLLTVQQACDMLRVSRSTLYRMVKRGELPCVRLGARTVRFAVSDLRAYLAQKKDSLPDDEEEEQWLRKSPPA